jgi:glycosyltransferase involved in cell wall biosynthesis
MRTRVIEALACGARTVSTSFGVRGLTEELGRAAPWRIGDKADSMAAEISDLLDGADPHLADRAIGYAARQYSWDGVAGQIAGIYRQLTSPNVSL